MINKKVFSVSKYNFLKEHSSTILELLLNGSEEEKKDKLDRDFALSFLDYLTKSKYQEAFDYYDLTVLKDQKEFEESIELIESSLNFENNRDYFEEINKILLVLKTNARNLLMGDDSKGDNEIVINTYNALVMYEEYNLDKKQCEEVTYGKHHK